MIEALSSMNGSNIDGDVVEIVKVFLLQVTARWLSGIEKQKSLRSVSPRKFAAGVVRRRPTATEGVVG